MLMIKAVTFTFFQFFSDGYYDVAGDSRDFHA
jgi:hypothetical protein